MSLFIVAGMSVVTDLNNDLYVSCLFVMFANSVESAAGLQPIARGHVVLHETGEQIKTRKPCCRRETAQCRCNFPR